MFLDFAQVLGGTPLSIWIQSHLWVTPLLQSIHIVMIGVVFVAVLMITLRVLGRVGNEETFAAVWNRFSPWMWGGIGVMALTGLVLGIAEPVREASALSFWLKMSLIVIGILGALTFGRTLRPFAYVGDTQFSGGAKAVAAGTVVLWLCIIFLGRAIAYDVEVWGSLHLGPVESSLR
ncbi:MAG: hypothetical protein ABI640_20260 [Gammaproteobacteria bacterium]